MRARLPTAISSLAIAALLTAGCAMRQVHPGHTLVRRKCTSCHSEPPREQLSKHDIPALMNIHAEDRIELTEQQVQELQSYVENGDP